MGHNLLTQVHPKLLKYVKVLQEEGSFGICSGVARIPKILTGCTSLKKKPCGDRFFIVLPYGGHSIEWEVIFNAERPADGPDFIFSQDEDFNPSPDALPHLMNWNADDPQCLLLVIEELLLEYKVYQKRLIDSYERLHFEYASLTEHLQLENKLEVHMCQNKNRGNINFLIKLDVDFSSIPAYLIKDNPGEDNAVLLVTFHSPDGTKITPQLFLSPRVEYVFKRSSQKLHIPPWPTGGCLMDYVPEIIALLKNQIEEVIKCYEKRKEYVAAFLSHFGRSVIEYDVEAFSQISFLMEWNDFFFIIHINLTHCFPNDPPIVTFQSIYHDDQKKKQPYQVMDNNYPYCPRWTANEMAERMRNYIDEYIPQFQKESVRAGTLTVK